jgi:acetolactate synthase small subunit
MKISIIFPTRKRYDLFVKSTNSLIENCSDLNNLEILVAMDDDDVETVQKTKEYIADKPFIKLYVSERHFYRNLNLYVNATSKDATGEFLLLWNDDCMMTSKDYDLVMDKYKNKFVVVNPLVTNQTDYCRQENRMLFPIIPKKWIDVTGRWSNSGACDSWVELISNDLNLSVYEDDIQIFHEREFIQDEITIESHPDKNFIAYFSFFTEEKHNERMEDLRLIRDYLNKQTESE